MIRNLKILGLALAAMFAFGALSASGAMAQNGTLTVLDPDTTAVEENGEVTLTGNEIGGAGANSLTAFGPPVECPESTFTGHKTKTHEQTVETGGTGQGHELLPNGATEFTITPHYVNCVTATPFGNFPTTVDMNGCDYEFALHGTNTEHEEAEDTYNVHSTVECPAGKHIEVTVFSKAAHEEPEGVPFCVSTIEENPEGYPGLVARDTTNHHLDITGTIEGIKVSRESPTGSILCEEETVENGVLHQDITIKGHDDEGEPTAIGLHHS